MTPRSPLATALGAAVLVVVCGVAAYVGASLVRTPAEPPAAGSGTSASTGPRLDELERDVESLKGRLARTEEVARTALDHAAELRDRLDAMARGPSATGGTPGAPAETKRPPPNGIDPDGTMTPEERAEALRVKTEQDFRKYTPMLLRFQFGLWSDSTPEGVESRKRQAWMEARSFAHSAGFAGEKEQEIREAFVAYYERCARDLGPAVKDFETADYGLVAESMPRLWSAFDEQLKGIVGEEKFKGWATLVERPRQMALEAYAEAREKR